jgi:immune inhibitor A
VKKTTAIILVILAAALALCCCLIIILGGVYYSFLKLEKAFPTLAATLPVPINSSTSTPFEITRQPADQIPIETLNLLKQTNIPDSNLAELACSFKDVCNIPPTMLPPAQPFSIGAQQSFWVLNDDTTTTFQVHATLRYITPHSYFWVADGVQYNQSEIKTFMDTFENKIYLTDRAFFGSEWTPGVDDDPHIYVFYTNELGKTTGGYFSSNDEYPPQISEYSNAHEMFYISSSQPLSDPYTFGGLAHEFQHMIHWYQDRNEMVFLNEGFSKLAEFINNYPSGGDEQVYMTDPDINLTDWIAGTAGDNVAHYGASFLFTTYFLDRFGEDLTKALVHDQENGLESLDHTLAQQNITDPLTDKVISADDFFLDWAVTNFVQDGSVGDGRFVYHNYPAAPQASPTEIINRCPADPVTRTVNQYGVDYIRINCAGNYSLHFEGATSTRLLPADPHSGRYAFWSNKGDMSDMTLTRTFDLTGASGQVSMDYWTWYDIEKDYDYVYVEASTDGQQWKILTTPSGTASNPNGASYGRAYTGQSNGWIQESVDLSTYAGQKVSVRFEYITDQAVNGEGFLLDDVSVPAINYTTDFENSDSSWQAAGFARIENSIPQTFRLAFITQSSGRTTVQNIPLPADQSADFPLTIGQNGIKDTILVVTGTTRFTRVLASYQFSIH